MYELEKIIQAYHATDFDSKKAALATVVKVTGSSYRSPGAKMFITDDGRWVGSISGGCLEGDALRKARNVMREGKPQLVTYDTMDDENNGLGVSLGCNGIIHVLIEPINNQYNPMIDLIRIDGCDNLVAAALVYQSTNSHIPVGTRMDTDSQSASNLNSLLNADLAKQLESKLSYTKDYVTTDGEVSVFFEVYEPPIDLLIFGGGFDAQPVAAFARQLGWKVTVLDECVAHLLPINFPDSQLQGCQRERVTKDVEVKPYSAAVLMSHNYHYDLEVLRQLIDTDISYIGILGPRKKGQKMFDELATKGIELTKDDHHRIHNPIGLDIGADTPEEIALSIVAEIKSKFAGRSSGFLKYKHGSIHNKDPKSGEVFKQVHLAGEELKKSG